MANEKRIYDEFLKWKDGAAQKVAQAREGIEEHVSNHPWQTIAVSAAAGVLLGMILMKRRH